MNYNNYNINFNHTFYGILDNIDEDDYDMQIDYSEYLYTNTMQI